MMSALQLVLTGILFLTELQLTILHGDSCYSCSYKYGDTSPTNAPGCADPTKNSSYLQKCDIGNSVCFFSMRGYKRPNQKPDPDYDEPGPYTIQRECRQWWPAGTPPEKRHQGAIVVEKECVDDMGRMPDSNFNCLCSTDKCNSLVVPYPGT